MQKITDRCKLCIHIPPELFKSSNGHVRHCELCDRYDSYTEEWEIMPEDAKGMPEDAKGMPKNLKVSRHVVRDI